MSTAPSGRRATTAWLILRRRGGLFGIRHRALAELTGSRRLELTGGESVVADELLGLAVGLESRPFPRCLNRFFPETVFGLAVWQDRPVILLEAGAPPPECLRTASDSSEKADDGDEIR